MFAVLRWIRRWREERELLEEAKAREAERQIQREKLDGQLAQALLLTLHQLGTNMDPLIAAQLYNNRFCRLTRLPEELLLRILDFLADDVITLYCLRIVSSTFFRLLHLRADCWKDEWYLQGSRPKWCEFDPWWLHTTLQLQFRRLLQRDGRCDTCARWNDKYVRRVFDDCKFQQEYRRYETHPSDRAVVFRRLYCNPCDNFHDVCQFSSAYQQRLQPAEERRCLGQQGSVQLCEHVQISWASIQTHIETWRQHRRGSEDWQACLNKFKIECHNISHDTRCTPSEAPTWPRARLYVDRYERDTVLLELEWAPHNRIDALPVTTNGRIPAPDLRAQFRMLRHLGPVDTLYPPGRPGALPEMACFQPLSSFGRYTYYNTGGDDEAPPPPPISSRLILPSRLSRRHGDNTQHVDIRFHRLKRLMDDSRTDISNHCLVVGYRKSIVICMTAELTDPTVKVNPTRQWLYAMDTSTYPHPQARQIRPQCEDEACVNYYRRQKNDFYV
jgi:hypothetical protein